MTNTAIQYFNKLQKGVLKNLTPIEQDVFGVRLETYWKDVLRPLKLLYGNREDFDHSLERLLKIVAAAYANRSSELKLLDLRRQSKPDWFQESDMIAYVCYTERFAKNLKGVANKIPYLKELGVTYLHLMPLLKPRPGSNDGGYAVQDYRQVREDLGTLADLKDLASQLRTQNISLCIDIVCNHTAKEHTWAQKAQQGDPVYQDYYLTFPDRTIPDKYERTTPEVFPEWAPGNFTWYEYMQRWVWTTFHEYQWDLNYTNPAVFGEMLDIILFLANQGVEILRLDAVAFMWKRLGTDSQNQPEAHAILQAFRALSRIAAPALLLKAEAIVSPDKLVPYLGVGEATNKECELAYHNVFMVLLWSALAERKALLLTKALQNMPPIPSNTAWCTYVRCHDDIGWAITDEDTGSLSISAPHHRAFLSDFYNGTFKGSFARGATFQFNPKTNDRRISGSCASLAGLEIALEKNIPKEIEFAIKRILLLNGLILVFGGIPLLYMGDELGLLNDYAYDEDPEHVNDNRWLHRPMMDWRKAKNRAETGTIEGRIFTGLKKLIGLRKRTHALHAGASTKAVWAHNEHVFGLLRESPRGRILIFSNFSETEQTVPAYRLEELGVGEIAVDLIEDRVIVGRKDLKLGPYTMAWLT